MKVAIFFLFLLAVVFMSPSVAAYPNSSQHHLVVCLQPGHIPLLIDWLIVIHPGTAYGINYGNGFGAYGATWNNVKYDCLDLHFTASTRNAVNFAYVIYGLMFNDLAPNGFHSQAFNNNLSAPLTLDGQSWHQSLITHCHRRKHWN